MNTPLYARRPPDVAVLFVSDEHLGGVRLLGMSNLENFAFTVGDEASQLVLTPR